MPARRFALLALLAAATPAAGQPPVEPVNGKVTIRLTVTPAKPLEPLSRVQLLPDYRDSFQGNAVQQFQNCFMEQDAAFSRAESERREKLLALPLDAPELKAEAGYLGALVDVRMADAARMSTVDWQIYHQMRRDGFGTLLPGEQKMRSLAQVLKLRARAEAAAGKPEAAVKTLQTMFALARTFDNHPTLIGHLIGLAVGGIALDVVEELVALPDCPNLFWALTDLPAPFLSTRTAVGGERLLLDDLRRLVTTTRPLTDAEVAGLFAKVEPLFAFDGGGGVRPFRVRLALRVADPEAVAADRKLLAATGMDKNLATRLTDLHAVAAADFRRYEVLFDDAAKWMPLPAHQALPGLDAVERKQRRSDAGILAGVIPANVKVRHALARVDQRLAALRVVEALRLHAAEHGAFPATLDDVKLPLPADPVTGKPFRYAVKDGAATVGGGVVNPGDTRANREYALTLRK